jgi:tRNA(Ile)-lysidine synthase TilS/MesJ
MIAFSGGQASRALVHMAADYHAVTSANEVQSRKFHDYVVVHIDQSSLFASSTVTSIRECCSMYPFEFVSVPLETVFNGDKGKLIKWFKNSTRDVTAQRDALEHLRMRLLSQVARQHGCDMVFVGDTATRTAERAMTDIACGRGFVVAHESGPQNIGLDNVVVWKPLRDCLSKEIALFNYFLGLKSVVTMEMLMFTYEKSIHALSQRNTTLRI